MSKRIFSSEEQQRLMANSNVKRCSERSITYTATFKERAVQQYAEGHTARDIFKQAGFDISLIGKKQPKFCLQRWRVRYKEEGTKGLADGRGQNRTGKKKRINTETDRLKWLEAEVKYLKAENAFLAQLRAKRAE